MNFFYLGVYLSLTLYHFLVWIGRKKDLSNLAFSLLSFSFAIIISLTLCYFNFIKNNQFEGIIGCISAMLITCSLTFLFYTLNFIPEKYYKYNLFGSCISIIMGISAIIYLSITKNIGISVNVYFSYTILYGTVGYFLSIKNFLKTKLNISMQFKMFMISLIILVISLIVILLLFIFDNNPWYYFGACLNIPFIILMFVFEYYFIKKFNMEHNDLFELKQNLEKKVEERTIQLKEATKQKSIFFMNLAHEIKTPLTAILNHLDMHLTKYGSTEELDIVERNFNKLKMEMVNFLNVEKLEQGRIIYIHDRIIDISQILKESVKLFNSFAEKKHITLDSKIENGLFVRIDPTAFGTIINNLLDNAIRYTKDRGAVTVSLNKYNNYIELLVKDTGPGIPAEQQVHLFEPFYQLSHNKKNVQGIGLGLSIVKKALDSVCGSIEILSSSVKGTMFRVVLKAEQEGDNISGMNLPVEYTIPSISSGTVKIQEPEYQVGRPTLLIVEDNLEMLSFYCSNLNKNYNIFYANNGLEALTQLSIIPKPNIILADIMMDEMDGYELYDRIEKNSALCDIPFLFITAKTGPHERLQGIRKGAIDFISKPFLIKEIEAKIASILSVQQKQKIANVSEVMQKLSKFVDNNNSPDGYVYFDEKCRKFKITTREKDVIKLLMLGLQNKEIASKLRLSENTVKKYISHIYKKCVVDNKVELGNMFRK